MKIVSAHVYALEIPFRNVFVHSTKTRDCSDSIVVALTSDNGITGFGEAVPRPYVTGETVESCIDHITKYMLPQLVHRDLPEFTDHTDPMSFLAVLNSIFPEAPFEGIIAMNAARAAVELACIDCILKSNGKGFAALVHPLREAITYSSVITAESHEAVAKIAQQSLQFGAGFVKVKIGMGDDTARVALVRKIMGNDVSIRVDANGAFSVKDALSCIESLVPYGVESIEQPTPRGDIKSLASIKQRSPIAVMADESLITLDDAHELIDYNACDLFNVRISKNGGCLNSIQIANIGLQAGMGIQFGCQVGETAILSAAGRHVAAHFSNVKYMEGSFGTYLLKEDISREAVMFGLGGKAGLIHGAGLGVNIDETILKRYSRNTSTIRMV